MSIKSRLKDLEKSLSEAAKPEPPWSPPEAYARMREDAQAEIEVCRKRGEEPLYWIDDDSLIRAADNDSYVRHRGDYHQALDRRLARLEQEIAEERASMTPEERQRAEAEEAEYLASPEFMREMDEEMARLDADIAEAKAKIAQGGGGA